jgi:Na+-transporting NADH:ubiquinone oxidoreductase subunit C
MDSDSRHTSRASWVQRFRDAPIDSPMKTLLVTFVVCIVCSVVVSAATVLLRPRQIAHQERERKEYILAILRDVPGVSELLGGSDIQNVEVRVVDLETGEYAESVDARTYDQRSAASDPAQSIALPPERDGAGLGRRARWATVYLVRDQDRIRLFILPVSGEGYTSTLYGYLAVDGDTNTIRALSFYEQGETPGLGAQIQDPQWQAQWRGKKIRDETGEMRVRVASAEGRSEYEVDGISGATMTGTGVTKLVRFWLGVDGFGPFLDRIAAEQGDS